MKILHIICTPIYVISLCLFIVMLVLFISLPAHLINSFRFKLKAFRIYKVLESKLKRKIIV